MIRRSFFQVLSSLFLPVPVPKPGASLSPLQVGTQSHAESISQFPSAFWVPSVTDPEWLRDWLRIPRLEIREDDLPHISDSHQRALAAEIFMRIRVGRPFAFRYLGGSTPGEIRRVLPTSLFGLDIASHYQFLVDAPTEFPEPADGPLYLLAWCQHRNAPRTFRLDRITSVKTTGIEG
jgi:hypothetical protein